MESSYDVLVIRGRINDDILNEVRRKVDDRQSDVVYLVIETFGGAPEVGFRIMSLLNALYKKIFIVIPNRAMSTGTLMALGGDKIFMYHSSTLGPLDLQIEHPADGSWISTLDVRDTMGTIISHTEIAAKRIYEQTYNQFGLSKSGAAKIANECAVKLIEPVVAKIDPYHLHKSFRSAEVGAKYGAMLLKNRMMKGREKLADLVSSWLANNYEMHNYAITLDEAKELLQLEAEDLAKLSQWEYISPTYNAINQGVRFSTHKKEEGPTQKPKPTSTPPVKTKEKK